ncbi:unnamed protein product [Effrenium voratum]|nr:unnamed protein product [Effrenium voratum]
MATASRHAPSPKLSQLGPPCGSAEPHHHGGHERLKSLADFDLGMPDVNDLPEITALMVECFDRIIAKKRWDSKIPFSEYVNPFIDQNEVKEIAQGVRMRLDVTLQFQSLRRPIKQDESVALVAREKQGGPLVAYVEICILPNDGRRPEDDDGKTTSGTTREPYLSNLCVSPAYRRSGIGRAMLRLAEDVIRFIWKDERIYLHIDNYDPARLLYESEGFVATGPMDSEQVTHMIKGLPPLEEEDEDDEDAEDEEELPAEAEAEAGEPLALPAGEKPATTYTTSTPVPYAYTSPYTSPVTVTAPYPGTAPYSAPVTVTAMTSAAPAVEVSTMAAPSVSVPATSGQLASYAPSQPQVYRVTSGGVVPHTVSPQSSVTYTTSTPYAAAPEQYGYSMPAMPGSYSAAPCTATPAKSYMPPPSSYSPPLVPQGTTGAVPYAAAPPSPGPGPAPAPSGPPVQPQRLTEGIPDPQAIEQQKSAYARSLDAQLEQGIKMIEQQNDVKKQALRQEAEMKKEQYFLQVEQQLRAQEMSVDQQANYQLMGLQQAAFERRAILDQQAASATLEYEQKRVQDDFAKTQYEHKKRAAQKQAEMQKELARQKEEFARQQRAMQEAYAQQAAGLAADRQAVGQYGAPSAYRQDAYQAAPAGYGAGYGAMPQR